MTYTSMYLSRDLSQSRLPVYNISLVTQFVWNLNDLHFEFFNFTVEITFNSLNNTYIKRGVNLPVYLLFFYKDVENRPQNLLPQ